VEHSPAPTMDIDVEWSLQNNLRSAIRNGLIESAHDASDGGLFTALVEMTLPNAIGFEIDIDYDLRIDGVLLGEAQSRVVVAIDPENEMAFTELMKELEQPISYLGVTGGDSCIINETSFGSITELNEMSQSTMPDYMAN
jgi:phosphoribosylformylglycinamidine synthase subunit PurL